MDTKKEEQGSYIAVKFSKNTQDRLANFAKTFGIDNRVPREKFHITVIYSTKPVPKSFESRGDIDPPILAQPKHLSIFTTQTKKRALVLEMDCPELVKRHEALMSKYELTYDYDSYKPHITLSYDVGDAWQIPENVKFSDINSLEIITEYHESLQLDWADKNTK